MGHIVLGEETIKIEARLNMSNEEIKIKLKSFVEKYSITKMLLFGSRANGTNDPDSDVDLILEFSVPVSLIILSRIRIEMEEALGISVDIVHGPITDDDMIVVDKEVVLYAA